MAERVQDEAKSLDEGWSNGIGLPMDVLHSPRGTGVISLLAV